MFDLLLTFLVGIIASIISGMAGGGSGLLSAPFFIMLGLPPQVALATTKFGALGVTTGAILKLRKAEHIRKEYVLVFSIVSIAAAVAGSTILLSVNPDTLERLLGIVMLISLPFLFFKDMGDISVTTSGWKQLLGYLCYFVILFLQAIFGGGIGMLITIILTGLFGFTTLEAISTRRIPGFILAALSLLIYMASGIVYYSFGIAMLAGMVIGGYIGTHIAVTHGNKFVKIVFSIVILILGIQLLV